MIIPSMWSDVFVKQWDRSMLSESFLAERLNPQDVWAPTGETYSEVTAFAAIVGVEIFKPHRSTPMTEPYLRLQKPGHTQRMLKLCSPAELLEEVRRLAAGDPSDAQNWVPIKMSMRL